jgi:GMP synthase-like glutamine amidotransferase
MADSVSILRHTAKEGPGLIEAWANTRTIEVNLVKLDEGEKLPKAKDLKMLVSLGGPMSVNDGKEVEWMEPELKLIKNCLKEGVPVLGVCLGAQMVAAALGAKVYKADRPEIGYFQVLKEFRARGELASVLPSQMTVLHWHGETFDLPEGAEHIYRSEGCKHQAFIVDGPGGAPAVGLQFHMECKTSDLVKLAEGDPPENYEGAYVQSQLEMHREAASHNVQPQLYEVLDFLWKRRPKADEED